LRNKANRSLPAHPKKSPSIQRRGWKRQQFFHDGVRILFDTRVPTQETVFCGIGRPDRTLEIQLADLVQITQGQIVPLTSDKV
jgi:hypothetical protein